MAVTVNGGAPSAPQIAEFKTVFDLLGLSTAALSVKANATNATAAATDVAAGTDGHVLRRSGTTLGFGTLATAGYGDATITLAKLADLAQDQFIGRTTASTGVPQTATITAAARTVLDDTTVANMVNTLGGATSTGTGGLARATSPTFVTPVLGTPSSGTLTNCTGLPTEGLVDAAVTLAKMANLAQDQFIGRTTASTGVPQTATITAAARTVLDDTTVAAMVNTLGGATSTGTGGLVRAASPTFTGTVGGITAAMVGALSASDASALTAGTEIAEDDEFPFYDVSDSDTAKTGTTAILRTRLANIPTGSALGTSGSVALDFATRAGTRPPITLTGNITFTTSNLAAGRHLELRLTGGGSTYTLTWPAFKAFGAALPTSLAAGAVLIVSLYANSTTDASVDAVAVLGV